MAGNFVDSIDVLNLAIQRFNRFIVLLHATLMAFATR
jgi:hypothetical protein